MARYWVHGANASHAWTDTTCWSDTDGGTTGFSVPDNTQDVYFKANSFPSTGKTVTMGGAGRNCKSFTWTGVTNNPTFNLSSYTLVVSGSITLVSGMTFSYSTGTLTCNGTGTVNLAGQWIYNMTFGNIGGVIVDLGSDIVCTTFKHENGTLNTNGYNITCRGGTGDFLCNGTNTRVLNLGSSIISVARHVTFTSTGLTFDKGTSKFIMNETSAGTFTGACLTFYDLEVADTGVKTIANSNTWNSFLSTNNKTITVTSGTTQTITTLGNTANYNGGMKLISSSAGSAFTLSSASTINISYWRIKDCTFSGVGSLTVDSGENISGNTNITFTNIFDFYRRYWVVNGWSGISGGTTGAPEPTLTEDVYFDENSLVANSEYNNSLTCRSVDCTGLVYNLDILARNLFTPKVTWNIYGSAIFNDKVRFGGVFSYGVVIDFKATSGSYDLDLVMRDPTGTWDSMTISGGATYTLLNNVISTSLPLILNKGTLNTDNKNYASTIVCTSANIKTLNLGSSIMGYIQTIGGTNTSINSGTSKVIINFASDVSFGDNYTWYDIEITGNGIVTFTGNSTYHDMKLKAGKNTKFTAGTTTTLTGDLVGNGSAGNLVGIISTIAGSQFTISKSSGIISVDYYYIKDSNATGGADWYAGVNSTNVSGNTGWIFTAPPSGFNIYIGSIKVLKVYKGSTEITQCFKGTIPL